MTSTDRAALSDRLSGIGLVTPTLAEGQPDTVRDIETLTVDLHTEQRKGGEAIINIGKILIEAKSQLQHGEWLDWLAEEAGYKERTAQAFMRIAREYSNPQLVADLGMRKALALLALPESGREGFLSETHQVNGEEKAVIDMTSRELEKAIKEMDEARKETEQAKADARAAAEERDSMEKSLQIANALLDRDRHDLELANGAVEALERQLAELKAAPVEVAVMEADQEAIEKARAEGEAAKAEEIADLQAKLDRAKEATKKADEKRKDAEAALTEAQAKLEESAKADKKAAAMADPDMAKFQVYFDQTQETVNKMRGLLLRARGREDQTNAEKMSKAILALGDAVKGAAK